MPPDWKAPAKRRNNAGKIPGLVAAGGSGGAPERQFGEQKCFGGNFPKYDTQQTACFATRHDGYCAVEKLKELVALSDNKKL